MGICSSCTKKDLDQQQLASSESVEQKNTKTVNNNTKSNSTKSKNSKNLSIRCVTLALLGLDNAGKTVTAKRLKGESVETAAPTIGFASENFVLKNHNVTLFDLGGGRRIRNIWKNYFAEIYGLVFVIDSSDTSRLTECREVLQELLQNDKVKGKPVLILANKQDLRDALDNSEISDHLNIESLANSNRCPCRIECCASLKPGGRFESYLRNGFHWLLGVIDADWDDLNERVEKDVKEQKEQEKRDKLERAERVRIIREQRDKEEAEQRKKEGRTEDTDKDDLDHDPFKPINSIQSVQQESANNNNNDSDMDDKHATTTAQYSPRSTGSGGLYTTTKLSLSDLKPTTYYTEDTAESSSPQRETTTSMVDDESVGSSTRRRKKRTWLKRQVLPSPVESDDGGLDSGDTHRTTDKVDWTGSHQNDIDHGAHQNHALTDDSITESSQHHVRSRPNSDFDDPVT